jgi:tetratricopeptide (TPR) repeat protein
MGFMDPRLAELSRTIDASELGRRIRNARIAAGMTQSQVAGDDVTAAYLSRIEDGQRRPEAGLLERMADRMNTTLAELVEDMLPGRTAELRLRLDHAELALAAGESSRALLEVDTVLSELTATSDPLRAAALAVRAGALEAEGDLQGAIILLEELTSKPSPDRQWLRNLISLSRCYRDAGEYDRAIAVGEEAQGKIEELGIAGLTEAIQLTVTVAGAYSSQGDPAKAMRVCLGALDRAEQYDSPIGKASAYWNASVIELEGNGSTVQAITFARKALALFELGEDNRNLAKLRAQVAKLQLEQDPPDAAGTLETLQHSERELAWSSASAWDRAMVDLTRSRAYLLLGDHAAALASAERAIAAAPAQAADLRAQGAALLGQVAAVQGQREDARTHYRQAVHLLSAAGADRGAAQLWFELADLLNEVGDSEGAIEAFRSAAASAGLQVQPRLTSSVRPSPS